MQQLGPQLKVLESNLSNLMVNVGKAILPSIDTVAKWALDVVNYFKSHPLLAKIASDSAIAAFGAAIAYKIAMGIKSAITGISSFFNGTAISANTTALDANTAALDALTGEQGAASLAPAAGGAEVAASSAGAIGASIGLAAAATIAATLQLTKLPKGKKSGISGGANADLFDLSGQAYKPKQTVVFNLKPSKG
jgi:hypothetical protein